jgi:hypothetical protein
MHRRELLDLRLHRLYSECRQQQFVYLVHL